MESVLTRQAGKIREWLGAILAPGQFVEVRALNPFASKSFHLQDDDLDLLAEFAAAESGRHKGIYFTPNPLREPLSGKHGTALDADVIERHWILIDADPARPKDTNATAEERAVAMDVIRSVRDTLSARGFSGMVTGDSGNGAHLMVPVRMPNSEPSTLAHRQLLRHLGERFGTDAVTIDPKTCNAARIWKLPATLAMKGPHSEERPNRYARLVEVPDRPQQHSQSNADRLLELLACWGLGRPWVKAAADDRAVLIRRALAYLEKEPPAVSGENGHDRCFHVACLLMIDFDLSEAEAFATIQPWNARCRPPWSEAELRHKFADAAKQPGPRGEKAGRPGPQPSANGKHEPAGAEPAAESAPITIRASAIVPKKVKWLWPGRIPLGKLTTFAGLGGIGKTFAMLDIAARVSRGSEWPGTDGECAEPGRTLFITAEDDPDDTLVPRLIEMGADLEEISFLRSEVTDRYTLADVPLLERAIAEAGPDVRFVAIDPPTAFLGGVNDHRNSELRGLLSPLKTLAAKSGVAIVFVTHLTKPQGTKIDAVMRIMGSVAWVNAVRAAHMLLQDPDEPERRIFACVKNNLGPEQKAIGYRLAVTDDLARIEWLGLVETTANDAMNNQPKRTRAVVASEWLVERFREQLEWRSDELFRAAKEAGVSRDAIFEAKNELDLPRARKVVGTNGDVCWTWHVPVDWPPLLGKTDAESF